MNSNEIHIRNDIKKNSYKFLRLFDSLSDDLKAEIQELLDEGKTPAQAVNKTFKDHHLTDKLKEWTLDGVVATAEATGIKFNDNLAARTWFLNEHFQGEKLTLSARVTNPAFKQDVISTLQANLSNSIRLERMTRELKGFTKEEDLRKGIREIERMARQIIAGDTSEFKTFQKAINAELKIAEKAALAGKDTVLSRSYLRVVKAAAKLKEEGIDKAIENAISKKARYAAFRLGHNEAARAYGLAVRTQAKNDPDATTMTWHLSSGEGFCDECAELDGQTFAIDDFPEYPKHINCRCSISIGFGPAPESSGDYETDDSTIPDRLLEGE
jgi:SPP1 gp7 family putative phage head morphogenesis protein